MSRAYAIVRFQDGYRLAGLYDGTSDIQLRALCDSTEEAWDAYRSGSMWPEPCGDPGEAVLIYSSYGSGHTWPGRACRTHRQITDGLAPWDDRYEQMERGNPEWARPMSQKGT